MVQSNTEYMSDTARAERVVRKFMNMTVKEFRTPQTEQYIDYITFELVHREDIPEEKVRDMSYVELACLIDQFGGNPRQDWKDHDSWSEQLFCFICVANTLVNGSKDSIPVRLFMALPIKAFYAYMGSKRGSCGYSLQSELKHITECCQYNEDYTIMDFLSEKTTAASKAWIPVHPLEEYRQKMMAAHRDIGSLLISSFRLAFPDRFHAEDIRDRYSDQFGKADPFYDELACEEVSDGSCADNWQQWEQDDISETESKGNVNRKEGN